MGSLLILTNPCTRCCAVSSRIFAGDLVYRRVPLTIERYKDEMRGFEHLCCVKFEDIPQPNKLEICTEVTTATVDSPGDTGAGDTLIVIRGVYYRADDFLPFMP